MANLTFAGRPIVSVFALLGENENDLTGALGFALDRCPSFLRAFTENLGVAVGGVDWTIRLQAFGLDRGFTDIELEAPGRAYVILEAKRGWVMPSLSQLERYLPRLEGSPAPRKALVTVSDYSADFAKRWGGLPARLRRIPLLHLPWSRVLELIGMSRSKGRGSQGFWLREFSNYLDEVIRVRREDSNLVYCVSLGAGTPKDWGISWREIVEKRGRYFHPLAKNWPTGPPNYLAFRYGGRLQSVHHVDDCKVVTRMHEHVPAIPDGEWEPHFLYTLGPEMRPRHEVKNGAIFPNGRYWCMLDLLLTASTVREARDLTKRRLGAEHARKLAVTEKSGGE